MPQPPRISAVGDWGPAIFQEINESLQDSKSINSSSQNQGTNKSTHPDPRLSSTSSIYSVTHVTPHDAGKQVPDFIQQSTLAAKGTRRESDASSYQPPQSHSRNGSRAGSGTSNHRDTKETGDLYDSYWRQSKDTAPGSSRQSRESSQAPGHSEEIGKLSTHGPVNGRGEMGKERRPGQLEVKVATIAEVPSPTASPNIGKAM